MGFSWHKHYMHLTIVGFQPSKHYCYQHALHQWWCIATVVGGSLFCNLYVVQLYHTLVKYGVQAHYNGSAYVRFSHLTYHTSWCVDVILAPNSTYSGVKSYQTIGCNRHNWWQNFL